MLVIIWLLKGLDAATGARNSNSSFCSMGGNHPQLLHHCLQKNCMMVQIGQMVQQCLKQEEIASGFGTQTDALVFGGNSWSSSYRKVKVMMEHLGLQDLVSTSHIMVVDASATSGNAYIAGGLTSPGASIHNSNRRIYRGNRNSYSCNIDN